MDSVPGQPKYSAQTPSCRRVVIVGPEDLCRAPRASYSCVLFFAPETQTLHHAFTPKLSSTYEHHVGHLNK